MTQLVGRLKRDSLAVRLIDPDDDRATQVEITDAAQALRTKHPRAQRDNLAELRDALCPDEEATLGLAMRVAALLSGQIRECRRK
jgi:DNA-binding MarR family transcriptional regulator